MPHSLKVRLKNLNRKGLLTEKDINRLISALEQEPCEDAISREELLKAIETWDKFGCDADTKLVPYKDHYIPYIHYDDVIKAIKGMPSVTPSRRKGHWKRVSIDKYSEHAHYWYECDKCGKQHLGNTNYCPYCGAEMVEQKESDHKCHTCKHYTSGERDGSCDSYICKHYSDWERKYKESSDAENSM